MVNIESMMRDDCFVVVECVDRNTFKMVGNGDTVQIGEEYGNIHFRYVVLFKPFRL